MKPVMALSGFVGVLGLSLCMSPAAQANEFQDRQETQDTRELPLGTILAQSPLQNQSSPYKRTPYEQSALQNHSGLFSQSGLQPRLISSRQDASRQEAFRQEAFLQDASRQVAFRQNTPPQDTPRQKIASQDIASDDIASHETPPQASSQLAGPSEPNQAAKPPREIAFDAKQIDYDSEQDIITASGTVVLKSQDQSLRAASVSWNRKTGRITASGNVRMVDADGNQLFTEYLDVTDRFEAGQMGEMLIALGEGGRLAARGGARQDDGTLNLNDAAYSACAVIGPDQCDKTPSWRVTADKVSYNSSDKKVYFDGAYLEIFGARLLPMPGLVVRTDGKAVSGLAIPDLRFSESNGVELRGGYYWRFAENKDLSLNGYVFSKAPPMLSAQWRHLTDRGAYQITGYATHSSRISRFTTGVDTGAGTVPNAGDTAQKDARGYIFANGKVQFNPHWSLTGALRRASDRTFLRRYDIGQEDRLRSTINLERISDTSYLSIAGWATQTLQIGTDQGQVPLALPVLDYRKRLAAPSAIGGTVEFQANTLAITRSAGQDTQRAFGSATWNLRRFTPMGQIFSLTALARGDIYHSLHNELTLTSNYRGNSGWQTRAIGLVAAEMEWPLIGKFLGGTQIITPRIQVVAAPKFRNLIVPNEDSRAIDLQDSNIFALNRFPGYDRVEDGPRVTYGFDWELQRPSWQVKASIAQSYRFDANRELLLNGTGLSERISDIVGRSELRYRDFFKFTHRYRLDKDNLAVRRNEFDATVGSKRTYAEIGYLRLNRNIDEGIEDLQDREELRAAARIAFSRYWSVFGSGVFNLTNQEEDPSFDPDGFEPVRTRLGIAYEDDCLRLGFTWRRDYTTSGDAQRGNTFQLSFALRNLGF